MARIVDIEISVLIGCKIIGNMNIESLGAKLKNEFRNWFSSMHLWSRMFWI